MEPFWLSRPGPAPDAATRAEFDALLEAALAAGPGAAIDYRLPAPPAAAATGGRTIPGSLPDRLWPDRAGVRTVRS